jgi:hypothetical protein
MEFKGIPSIIPPAQPPGSHAEKEKAEAVDKHCGFYYQMGYHDGFAKGQEQGIKLAADILNTKPGQTIYIQTPSEDKAKELIEAARKVFSRQK